MTPVVVLTPRERQVYRLLKAGKSDKEIAQQLGIAPNTARVHVRNVRRRLGTRVFPRQFDAALGRKSPPIAARTVYLHAQQERGQA